MKLIEGLAIFGIVVRFNKYDFLPFHERIRVSIENLSPSRERFAVSGKCLAAAICIDIFPLITSSAVRATFISCQFAVVVR